MALEAKNSAYLDIAPNFRRVEGMYERAETILANTLGKTHPDYASNLFTLATLYSQGSSSLFANDQRQGIIYSQSEAIRRNAFGTRHPDYAASLNVRAHYQELSRNYPLAEALHLNAINIKLEEFKRNMLVMSEKGQQAFLKRNKYFFENFRRFVLNLHANQKILARRRVTKALFELEVIIKAQLLGNKQRLQYIISRKAANDPELQQQYQLYRNLKAKIAKYVGRARKKEMNIEEDLSKINTLEKQFFTIIRHDSLQADYGFESIRKKLGKGEALVEIVRQDKWVRYDKVDEGTHPVCALIFSPVRFFTDVYNFFADLTSGRLSAKYIYMAF